MSKKLREYRTHLDCIVLETEDEIVLSTPPQLRLVKTHDTLYTWLMNDICSTPYAETRS